MTAGTILTRIGGGLVALAFMLPAIWMLTSAIRPNAEIFAYLFPLTIHSILPDSLSAANVLGLLHAGFARALLNSIITTAIATAVGVTIATLAGFALAVLPLPGRNVLFAFFVIGFSVPFDAVSVPLANQVRLVGLDNTQFGLAVAGIGNGLAIYLLRQFFLAIPVSLAEAARIDGAGALRTLLSIYLPLAKGPVAAAGLTVFVFQWQAYLWPLLVASDPSMQVGPVALAGLTNLNGLVEFGQMFAGALLLSVIPALIMLWLQRYFVSSVSRAGITG